MAEKYQAYREYKPSTVQWLGEIPKHWEQKRIKETAGLINGYPFDSKKFEAGKGVPLVRIRDIRASKTEVGFVGEVPPESLIDNGDVLVGMDGDFNVSLWSGGEAALNQRVACVRAVNYHLQKFIYYVLPFNMKVVNDLTYFTTVKHLSSIDILKTVYALPPEEELNKIVGFLDHETTKIDTLIEKQQQLIKLLKEKRQAVISHAVTKGLNSNAPMRDSGVEWLGEVPEHWVVTPLKYVCDLIDGDRSSTYPNESDLVDDGIPFVSSKNLVGYKLTKNKLNYITQAKFHALGRGKLMHGDLVITVRGTIGHVGVFDKEVIGCDTGFINAQMMIMRPKGGLTDYLQIVSESITWQEQLDLAAYGSTVRQLSNEVLGNIIVVVPPKSELKGFVGSARGQSEKFEALIQKAESAIKLMQERRTALISAAVTGKIDVRGWQPPAGASTNYSSDSLQEATS